MGKRRKLGGRTTPKGTQPKGSRPKGKAPLGPVVEVEQGREMSRPIIVRGHRMMAQLPEGHAVRDGGHFYRSAVLAAYDNLGGEVPCWFCERPAGENDPDPCLGMIEGATDACCGHGHDVRKGTAQCYPYVRFGDCSAEDDDTMIDGDAALDYFEDHGIGPFTWFATLTDEERERWADARLLPENWDEMSEAEQAERKAAHQGPTDRLHRQVSTPPLTV